MASKASDVQDRSPSTSVDYIDSSYEKALLMNDKDERLVCVTYFVLWSLLTGVSKALPMSLLRQNMAYNELVEDGRIRTTQVVFHELVRGFG